MGSLGCWQPLEYSYVKLNVDGALFIDFQVVGISAILRDTQGDVLLAASIKEKGIQDPETIENLSILCGLQLCVHFGITQLLVEFDCQSAVKEILSNKDSISLWATWCTT